MKRTISRLFDTRAQAEAAIRDLEDAGFDHDDLSLIARETVRGEDRSFGHDKETKAAEGAGKGAVTGGILGGGAGLLAGLGLMAIPGIGPVVAAGWLASTVAGAVAGAAAGGATGGLLGALKREGVEEADANVYAEGVRRGGALVSLRAKDEDVPRAEAILNHNRGVDALTRGSVYRQEGWTHFDESTPFDDGASEAGIDRPV